MRRCAIVALGLSALLVACGDDDDGDVGPDLPEPVASVQVEPADLELVVGEESQLTVTLLDASGNELSDRTVTYSSDDDAVATVSSSGLVTAVGDGTATITVTSEGQSATVSVAVALPEFAPTEDVTVSGTQEFASLDVPEGVTVTLTGDAELIAEGDASIAGAVVGDCTAMTVGGAAVTVTGTLNNICEGSTDPGPTLSIVGNGALTIQNARIGSSGDVSITNDPTLTDDDFDAAFAAARNAASFSGHCVVDGLLPVEGNVTKMSDGAADETTGGDGSDSGNWIFDCNGDIDFNNESEINTPDAGDGGAGEDDSVTDPDKNEVKGGNGGNGGRVRVRSTGDINFNGLTVIKLAEGGDGGNATMVAANPGGSATATGGDGGDSGTMLVQANGGITIQPNAQLEIQVGDGGAGGVATATAADGADAGSEAAQAGGSATATGGAGGSTPDARLRATGNVTGADGIIMTGGNGGLGGAAFATAGNGGNGNEMFPDGARGGDIHARGGMGGSSLAENLEGIIVGDGGDGGNADYAGGMGGDGFNGCSVDPAVAGGNGGNGGDGSGGAGDPGTGFIDGDIGHVVVAAATGDGGDGGDGDGPGSKGMGGTDGIEDPAASVYGDSPARTDRTDEGPNFQDGEDGLTCEPAEIDLTTVPEEFDHEVGVTECPQTIGTFTITNNSDATITWSATTKAPLGLEGFGIAAEGTIAAGESVTVTVIFDCSQTNSFTETITVQAGGETFTIEAHKDVKGNIN